MFQVSSWIVTLPDRLNSGGFKEYTERLLSF